ncbi:MAG: hypothetical protein HOG89_00060 [Candidatus Peribacter sp.]|jgi:hypothetical protein|nr:hypothetical protein [Candidatus Peribacter sp.]MBT4392771.1 hypothetical protein [Candidatus Peribacter sp.]MBT4600612.1 hypothetical protein [Candidatus Peribacter sp.]MBT5148719.1 hypothetical protein [Candidatus Peribacter sp.]MBT5637686.1 hypothetical protein [Candidatus Peribacter sp.]
MLSYLFWPNPPVPSYDSPKVVIVLLVCVLLMFGSFAIKRWRNSQSNAVTRKLSRSWQSASFWFGIVGLFMAVCRVEGISYLSMRFWWVVWGAIVVIYIGFQIKMFRSRHYEIVPQEAKEQDPREKYLPKKKK